MCTYRDTTEVNSLYSFPPDNAAVTNATPGLRAVADLLQWGGQVRPNDYIGVASYNWGKILIWIHGTCLPLHV